MTSGFSFFLTGYGVAWPSNCTLKRTALPSLRLQFGCYAPGKLTAGLTGRRLTLC